jgi:hypothetical protein
VKRIYYLYPVLVIGVFLAIIQVSTLTPYWNTSARSVGGASVGETTRDGGTVVLVNTADIRGTWTIADTATTFQVPAAEIKAHFGIPADVPDSTAVNALGKWSPGYEVTALREWLKERSPVAVK